MTSASDSGSGPNVIDVSEADFAARVIAESRTRPVLVDFWAPWCGPCLMLGPVLERAVADQAGRVLLAKVNTDENPNLAQTYGIRGIPNVKAFSGGAVVDEFVGNLPESQVRAFIAGLGPSPHTDNLDIARDHILAGRPEEALAILDQIPLADPNAPAARPLAAWARLARESIGGPDAGELADRIVATPGDVSAHLALAVNRAAAGDFEDALDGLMPLVVSAAPEESREARALMVRIFDAMGDTPATRAWQTRLAAVLY